jgi:hypothetical protein
MYPTADNMYTRSKSLSHHCVKVDTQEEILGQPQFNHKPPSCAITTAR